MEQQSGKGNLQENRRGNRRSFYRPRSHAAPPGKPSNISGVIGVTGLKHIGGQVREEYLTAIRNWKSEVKLYMEMRDDPIIGALLDAIKLPLQAASFDVEPSTGGGVNDEAAAEWLFDCMNKMSSQTWNSHVEDALECLDFGFSLGEITLDKRNDGRLWLKNIDPRGQETLLNWGYDPTEKDKLVEFVQSDPNYSTTYTIPLAKCLHFKYHGRKGNPQGRSVLRALYRPYKFARNLEDLEGIGVERDVGGMPIAKLGEGSYSPQDITDLKAALKGLRKDEEMFLIEPDGVDIRAYEGGSRAYDVNQIIDRWHKITLMRFFAQFLILGMGEVGTQSLVKGSQDFFVLALEAVQRYLLESWNLQLVPYLFRFNTWSGLSGYPSIVWEKPGKPDLGGLMDVFDKGIRSGVITATDADEDHIRGMADLPDLPDDQRGLPRTPEQPALLPGLGDIQKGIDGLGNQLKAGAKK